MKVEIEIGQLVLHGFSPADRHAVGTAMKRELERRLAEPGGTGNLARGATVSRVDAGSFVMPPGSSAGTAGGETARVLYERLKK